MKSILESLRADVTPLTKWMKTSQDFQINEGLRDVWNALKTKFKQVVNYLSSWVVRLKNSSYWVSVDDAGEVQSVITPLTAGQAYADGNIDRTSTAVIMDRHGSKITGCKCKPSDCEKLYGPGNSLDYWNRMVKESLETGRPLNEMIISPIYNPDNINEVKMHTTDPSAKYNVVDTPGLKAAIRVALKNKGLNRLLIYGAPGIGKTAILNCILQEFGMSEDNLITKTLSNETPDNFTLPKYVEVKGQDKATDIPKTWLPVYKPTGDRDQDQVLDDACGKGLLFIDELSRATPQVLNVILPLINEGKFNEYKIGSGWTIICASNRVEDEMSGQSDIGNALGNRFRIVYYEPTCKSWTEWAKTEGYMSPLLLNWLNLPEHENMSGGKYFYWDPNEEGDYNDPSKIMCTPRSWTNAMRTVCAYAETASLEKFKLLDIPRDIIACALNQCIPSQAVDGFLAFLDVIKSVGDIEEVTQDIWHNDGKGVHLDKKSLNKVALQLAQLICTAHADTYPTAEEFNSLCTWLVSQKSDQIVSYMLDILQNVYAGMLPESSRPGIFVLARNVNKVKAAGDQKKLIMYETCFRAFLDRWGFTLDTVPDWSAGQMMLAKAYGAVFSAAQVDGKDGLG